MTDLTFQKEIQRLLKESNKSLEEINAELETSNHELQQFASIASHDLQEPLRKILIFSTMLRDKQQHELSENSLSFLGKIIASSQRMRTMISDILSYSRLPGNTDEFEITNLAEVVTEVLDDYEILISEKKATIIIGTLPEAEVNRGQIRQVFQNLISNSLKFSRPDVPLMVEITSRENPKIEVTPKKEGLVRTCSIEISDNGIGFDELYSKKIFTLFQRLNTKDKYEGSGIGLAIAKKIMDRHNGTISASGKEGHGARFTITLPLRRSGR
ncbi:sensor histidine kinase [Dyadobacter helix]|uniref:sensor histidine kinase n=1 Tax=Dyadobacter helix TaxID=2822344 RepID=UPI001BFC4BD9|nr:ATP-binding protein [Dyadobacter sp. CECT 9275]